MVSLDTPEQNREFAESAGADLVLLSDPSKEASRAFGVMSPSGAYTLRWTFYIDGNGLIKRIDKNVDPASHGQEIVRSLTALSFQGEITPTRGKSPAEPET